MTSVIIGFIIQYQFVTTLHAGRVMGRVNNTPQPAPFFSENPSATWSKCVYHHSSTCRVPTFSLLESWKNSRMRSAPDPYAAHQPRRMP